ncbi:60S ribosomal protein L6 [Ceratobasidium theobromae]|uniref:60S ribosomal protein L6 n=1 Tax=Ceratobasidium theobromae TaxID=1582974 RepID=A0A5N5QN95_9AGAM|nr:60S ribosomal protein L6 [Ceratobasidium theobromae]
MARTKDSRASLPTRRGLKSKLAAKESGPEHKEVQVKGDKNGGTRLVPTSKAARYYPGEDIHNPKRKSTKPSPTKLRDSITPGTVLILLAGRFRGKRVVFLKQLESGLLLVTGPYKINGVPLRRVNQAYVIATSTKVDLSGVSIDEKLNDAYFAKPASAGSKDKEAEFFSEGKPKPKDPHPEAKASDQKTIDQALLAEIKKTENLSKYLKASFGLSKGQPGFGAVPSPDALLIGRQVVSVVGRGWAGNGAFALKDNIFILRFRILGHLNPSCMCNPSNAYGKSLEHFSLSDAMGFGLCALVLGHSVIGQSNDLASKVNLFIETTPKGVASQYEYMRRLSCAVITFFREQLPPWMIKAGLDMDSLDRHAGHDRNIFYNATGFSQLHDSRTGGGYPHSKIETWPFTPCNRFSECPTSVAGRKIQRQPLKDGTSPNILDPGYFATKLVSGIQVESTPTRRPTLRVLKEFQTAENSFGHYNLRQIHSRSSTQLLTESRGGASFAVSFVLGGYHAYVRVDVKGDGFDSQVTEYGVWQGNSAVKNSVKPSQLYSSAYMYQSADLIVGGLGAANKAGSLTMRAQAPRKKFPILILEEYGESDQMHMERVVWAGLGGRDGRRQGYDRVIVLVDLSNGHDHRAGRPTASALLVHAHLDSSPELIAILF